MGVLRRDNSMNIEKLVNFSVAVALAAALVRNLDNFTHQVRLATLKVAYESQTSAGGSPRFLAFRK